MRNCIGLQRVKLNEKLYSYCMEVKREILLMLKGVKLEIVVRLQRLNEKLYWGCL